VKQVKVNTLRHWDKNPRDITEDQFHKLLKQLRYGEVENLIVLTDGTVLNGNRRLDAYNKVGKTEAWVSEVEIVPTDDGKFNIIVDGELAKHVYPKNIAGTPVVFSSELQAKVELMALGNSHVGTFNDIGLAELLTVSNVEPDLFEINMGHMTRVEDLVKAFGPSDLPQPEPEPEPEVSHAKEDQTRELKIPCTTDEFVYIIAGIKRAKKEGGFNTDSEVLFEAMIAMDERMEAINYNG
jgi:hypothetical protein